MGSATLVLPNISDFDICPHFGFAAADGAYLDRLPSPYYDPWTDIACDLAQLIANGELRSKVQALPLLTLEGLETEAERRRAYLVLAMLTQAYVFADLGKVEPVIPPAVSEPFLAICEYWGLQPVLSYIGYCMWNWKIKDGDRLRDLIAVDSTGSEVVQHTRMQVLKGLHNVESCASFTGTLDEKAFALVPLLVEAEGGPMVAMLLEGLCAADRGDVGEVVGILKACLIKLVDMANLLQVLHVDCDPLAFYDRIRPFIAGSRGMESKGLPDGFIFELSNGQRVASKCVGASAGQTSLFQFLDHIFGINHTSKFPQEIRLYMPVKHRQFLETMETLPGLRPFVQMHLENEDLQSCFNQCIVQIREWRTRHIGVVTRYIVMPAKRNANQEGVKGTAGSLPIPFLKGIRDETV